VNYSVRHQPILTKLEERSVEPIPPITAKQTSKAALKKSGHSDHHATVIALSSDRLSRRSTHLNTAISWSRLPVVRMWHPADNDTAPRSYHISLS